MYKSTKKIDKKYHAFIAMHLPCINRNSQVEIIGKTNKKYNNFDDFSHFNNILC